MHIGAHPRTAKLMARSGYLTSCGSRSHPFRADTLHRMHCDMRGHLLFQKKRAWAVANSQSEGLPPQERMERLQEESSEKLEDALDNVEENLDAQVADALSGLVGTHKFDDEQLETFKYLVSQMRQCAMGLFTLAGVIILLVVKQVWEGDPNPMPGISLGGVAVSRLSHALNAILVAALMWGGAVSFKKVLKEEVKDHDNQLPYAFQGIIQLSIIFMQIAPITVSFAIVNIVEAAVRWPEVATVTAACVALSTIVRASSLAVLLTRYMPGQKGAARVLLTLREGWKGLRKFPLFPDRAALIVSAGLLLPYSTPDFATSISKAEKPEEVIQGGPEAENGDESATESADKRTDEDGKRGDIKKSSGCEGSLDSDGGHQEYEFTKWEERVLEVVMDAMRMAALALSLQALSSVLLGVAVGIDQNWWDARNYFMNDLVDQTIRAVLLFASAGCFRRVSDSSGHDITHLLEGLGKDHGLGKLFARMQKLAWGMATFKSLDLVLPFLMATQTWQKVQAWLVRCIVEYIPKGAQLTAAVGL